MGTIEICKSTSWNTKSNTSLVSYAPKFLFVSNLKQLKHVCNLYFTLFFHSRMALCLKVRLLLTSNRISLCMSSKV